MMRALGALLVVLGLALCVQGLWQEHAPQNLADHARQIGLPIGIASAQLGALLLAVPDFFAPV